MYKKLLSICLSIVLAFGVVVIFSSCGTDTAEITQKYDYDSADKDNMISFISNYAKTQSESIHTRCRSVLSSLGEDYTTYLENKSGVESFLQDAQTITDDVFTAYKSVNIDYSKLIAKEDLDYYDYEGALETLAGATEKGFEGYCEALEDAIDDISNKCEYLIGTAEGDIDDDELSDEEDKIHSMLSDGYDALFEKASDYYDYFYSLISEILEKFSDGKKDVDKIVQNLTVTVTESTTEQPQTTTHPVAETTEKPTEQTTEQQTEKEPIAAGSVEALEAEIIKYVKDEIAVLNEDFTKLTEDINTYDKYLKNIEDVEAFYEKISNTSYSISVRLCEYSVEYAQLIIDSDMPIDDMYDAFDGLYDCIYEDAADELYDGIYDGILDDMSDTFYDGVVSDGADSASYSDWYDVSSDAYEIWYDTSSDCYEHWYDMKSDIYGFCSDVRSEVYKRDFEGAEEEIADFKEDIIDMKND